MLAAVPRTSGSSTAPCTRAVYCWLRPELSAAEKSQKASGTVLALTLRHQHVHQHVMSTSLRGQAQLMHMAQSSAYSMGRCPATAPATRISRCSIGALRAHHKVRVVILPQHQDFPFTKRSALWRMQVAGLQSRRGLRQPPTFLLLAACQQHHATPTARWTCGAHPKHPHAQPMWWQPHQSQLRAASFCTQPPTPCSSRCPTCHHFRLPNHSCRPGSSRRPCCRAAWLCPCSRCSPPS
mmetsp:Transcript_23441/g.60024  ORF Transcript_23441/g.60024 Transcript_23441/m.60024 type:complete len:238 (+) Transcript_23441:553-1266(+)